MTKHQQFKFGDGRHDQSRQQQHSGDNMKSPGMTISEMTQGLASRLHSFASGKGLYLSEGASVVPAWIISFVLFISSSVMMGIDFMTSVWGYQNLRTSKAYDFECYAVATFPQAGQVALWREFMKRGELIWLAILSLLFIADTGTDVAFRCGGDKSLLILAIVQSIIVSTVGSELLWSISSAALVELTPEFITVLGQAFGSVLGSFGSGLGALAAAMMKQRWSQQQKQEYACSIRDKE